MIVFKSVRGERDVMEEFPIGFWADTPYFRRHREVIRYIFCDLVNFTGVTFFSEVRSYTTKEIRTLDVTVRVFNLNQVEIKAESRFEESRQYHIFRRRYQNFGFREGCRGRL